MTRLAYDTVRGIKQYLGSLEGLNRLARDRMKAGYDLRERLNDFCVLGRYVTDGCGNFCKITSSPTPRELVPDLPDVISMEDLWKRLPPDTTVAYSHAVCLPPENIVCAHCGKAWTIADCHDLHVTHTDEVVPLRNFIGQTLGAVKDIVKFYQHTAVWFMQPGSCLRNDRFIDLRPNPKYPTLKVNERGWVGQREGIGDDYVIQPGDEGSFSVWRYYHKDCNRQRLEREERLYFKEILLKAGYGDAELTAIPNGYCPCENCAPWFKFQTHLGAIVIGWRKRVINIDWSDTRQDMHLLFCSEDVTKGQYHIHAYGKEKAVDYLMRLWLAFFRREPTR